jgi:hypothetical protein
MDQYLLLKIAGTPFDGVERSLKASHPERQAISMA